LRRWRTSTWWRIYDQGVTGDRAYLAMEFLPSGTLASRIREGLDSRAALRLAAQIARALDAIHSQASCTRDLKPTNILFRANGQPVIVDFGLARDLAANSNLTVAGQLLATPRYMSPEHFWAADRCALRSVQHGGGFL